MYIYISIELLFSDSDIKAEYRETVQEWAVLGSLCQDEGLTIVDHRYYQNEEDHRVYMDFIKTINASFSSIQQTNVNGPK